jgi:DNA-binding transcriptional ArsR family regulator
MKLSDNILEFLNGRGFVVGGNLERQEFYNQDGFLSKPSSIGRALRRLAENGQIKKEERRGYVWYCGKSNSVIDKINAESARMKAERVEDRQTKLI